MDPPTWSSFMPKRGLCDGRHGAVSGTEGLSDAERRDARQAVISDALWSHALQAITGNLPSAALTLCAEEDVQAAIESLIERLDEAGLTVVRRDRIGMYLMGYATGGDESDPWQAGHNYAMGEAARMVLECWDLLPDGAS
jgi:hypothetical protein